MFRYFVSAAGLLTARLHREDRGVTAVEYGLILALIAGVIIAGLLILGPALAGLFSSAGSCVSAATTCSGISP